MVAKACKMRGGGTANDRLYVFSSGGWLVVRSLDDGDVRALTSDGLIAWVELASRSVVVHVAPAPSRATA